MCPLLFQSEQVRHWYKSNWLVIFVTGSVICCLLYMAVIRGHILYTCVSLHIIINTMFVRILEYKTNVVKLHTLLIYLHLFRYSCPALCVSWKFVPLLGRVSWNYLIYYLGQQKCCIPRISTPDCATVLIGVQVVKNQFKKWSR